MTPEQRQYNKYSLGGAFSVAALGLALLGTFVSDFFYAVLMVPMSLQLYFVFRGLTLYGSMSDSGQKPKVDIRTGIIGGLLVMIGLLCIVLWLIAFLRSGGLSF